MCQIASARGTKDSQRIAAGHPRVQSQIAGKITDIRLDAGAVAPAFAAEDSCRAACWPQESEEHANGRRLSCAIRPEESEKRALLDGKGHAFYSAARSISA